MRACLYDLWIPKLFIMYPYSVLYTYLILTDSHCEHRTSVYLSLVVSIFIFLLNIYFKWVVSKLKLIYLLLYCSYKNHYYNYSRLFLLFYFIHIDILMIQSYRLNSIFTMPKCDDRHKTHTRKHISVKQIHSELLLCSALKTIQFYVL